MIWEIIPHFPSLVISIIAIIAACYAFSPNLTIETIKNGPQNTVSRIIIKNIGMIPAYNITANGYGINYERAGITSRNNRFTNYAKGATLQLATDETMEIPACVEVVGGLSPSSAFKSCDYDLVLKYDFKIFGFTSSLNKKWFIKLQNAQDGFVWTTRLRGFISESDIEKLKEK